jgi:D-glycero-alpha-D-manno-heptose-7-phosphate kinase
VCSSDLSGGFLMFYAHEDKHPAIEKALHFLRRISFKFEPSGSRIIFYNPTNG